jgi:ribonuclease HI
MAKNKKYYVVWHGLNPGIYNSWAECLAQVKAFPNAKYKAFTSLQEAKEAFNSNYEFTKSVKSSRKENWRDFVLPGSIAVDAACSGNPGDMEYRGIDLDKGVELFHIGPLASGTNNIGEFLAIVHALAFLKKLQDSKTAIYSDSKIAMNWVKRKEINTKLIFNGENRAIQELISRAIQWLKSNTWSNKILKWDTDLWGENPADFGRK